MDDIGWVPPIVELVATFKTLCKISQNYPLKHDGKKNATSSSVLKIGRFGQEGKDFISLCHQIPLGFHKNDPFQNKKTASKKKENSEVESCII